MPHTKLARKKLKHLVNVMATQPPADAREARELIERHAPEFLSASAFELFGLLTLDDFFVIQELLDQLNDRRRRAESDRRTRS